MPIAAQRNSSPSSLLTIDGAEMILIPEGKFLLGSPNGDTDTQPMRECFLPAYYIDRYPVTNERYLQFIKNAGHPPPAHWWNPKEHGGQFFAPEKAHHPVTNIHYQDAIQYCEWSGKRLPTEAEWEKAARTSDGRAYPWGIHWQKGIANFGTHQTTPVYAFPEGQSPYGAYDLLGNTWEWVTDWYSAETYQHINPTTPHGPQQGTHRVIRGGSYADPPSSISSYTRGYRDPLLASPTLGFRCALHSPNSSRKNL